MYRSDIKINRMTFTAALVLLCAAWGARGGQPVFDPSTLMRLVLVPADATVGSVIYRVRASDPDYDYPLHFELIGQMGRLDIGIESLPCTRYNSVCQANVILLRRLEPGRYVDFRLSVRNTRGSSSRIACSITGTNATTPRDTIFPHQPSIILVPEDAKRGTDLEIVIARKNPLSPKPLELELWGSPLFAIRQRRVSTENTEGTIFLVGPLDFEAQSMYHLTLLAVDPYVEIGKDTRNIAGLEVVLVVQDVQDMPPVFTAAPPITHLPRQVVPGDMVVKVRAEDGDKGAPRPIRYGLVSEGNPFTPFFNINETTGEVTLERPIEEIAAISHAGAPILLTVVAEEVRLSREEPEAMSSTVQLAFILPERENSPPYFENQFYITYLDENALQGTALTFNDPYIPQVNDNDAGKNGVFSLTLVGNNGTFEISPTVAERHAQFIIKVRDNTMLDFEARKSVIFQILAQELGPATNLSALANVTVYLNDVNDNPPVFLAQSYDVELHENVTAGVRVTQVAADDVDTGSFGKIQYTAILGYLNTSLHLDPTTGLITVATNNHGFDREAMPDLHFLVEARDEDGVGLRVTVPLIIKLLDVNDNPPEFERSLYEFVLSPSLNNFTSAAFVKAVDKDAESPNNVVRYEIIQGNSEGKFAINEETGELYLLEALKRTKKQNIQRRKRQFESDQDNDVFVLTIRAHDLGEPMLYSTTMVKIYPPESKTRTMSFIVPGVNPDRKKLEEVLTTLSGGKVTIIEIKPYKGQDSGTTDLNGQESSQTKSEVIAVVRMTGNTAINVAKLQEQLAKNVTIYTTGSGINSGEASTSGGGSGPISAINPGGGTNSGGSTGITTNTNSGTGNPQTNSGTIIGHTNHGSTADNGDSNLYRAESRLLFWLLILLAILVALVLLLLICCCICEGCPLYMPPRKRVIRVNSTEDDVHLVVRDKGLGRENKTTQNLENKSIQATEWRRREAWSAEQADLRTKPTQWKFNKRNYRSKEPSKPASTPGDLHQEFVHAAEDNDYRYNNARQSFRMRDGPNVIYTKEMQLQEAFANKHKEYIEDLENGYDRIATLHYQRREQDNDSIRRHEIDRGSEVGVFLKSDVDKNLNDKVENRAKIEFQEKAHAQSSLGRDQYFIKDGNTEILRLVTRGKNEEDRYVNLPIHQQRPVTLIPHTQYVVVDSGKDLLMERFIREQGEEAKHIRERMDRVTTDLDNVTSDKEAKVVFQRSHGIDAPNQYHDYSNVPPEVPGSVPLKTDYLQSALLEMQNKSSIHQELLESSLRKQNELLHQILIERERLLQNQETASQVESKLETQSLPGHSVIATQTECHIGTQTEPQLLKPTRRKARSDNDSYSEDESQMVVEDETKKVAWVKRKKPKKKVKYKDPRRSIRVYDLKRKIKTPIIEESEVSPSLESEKHVKISKTNEREEHIKNYGDRTKSTVTTSKNETVCSTQIKLSESDKQSRLRKEILMEISDSLEEKVDSETSDKRLRLQRQSPVEDDISPKRTLALEHESSKDSEQKSRNSSASKDNRNLIFSRQGSSTEARELAEQPIKSPTTDEFDTNNKKGSSSNAESSNKKNDEGNESTKSSETGKAAQKSLPRYMQWYGKKSSSTVPKPPSEKVIPSKPKRPSKSKNEIDKNAQKEEKSGKYGKIISKDNLSDNAEAKKNSKTKESEFIHLRLLKEEKVTPVPEGPLPDVHPLLQHSEHRYEHQYENQNPLCYIQPTHIPKYLGGQPNIPRRQSIEQQPIYVNQDDVKKNETKQDISESALTHSISISTSYEEDKKNAPEVHVSKINIGGDSAVEVRTVGKIDDNDSGIAMSTLVQQTGNIKRLPITEKKSIFTIAYDDVQTKQLRPDSSSTSY
ncbi:cadherin-86C [Galleria mellonella]|uniref:Cadherin-86C n=1 Tax=Galleria mellonella TaxID=7137 RepID=A0ABM3MY75_GALME|nr:cadherin-86C [Galleria mellonella]